MSQPPQFPSQPQTGVAFNTSGTQDIRSNQNTSMATGPPYPSGPPPLMPGNDPQGPFTAPQNPPPGYTSFPAQPQPQPQPQAPYIYTNPGPQQQQPQPQAPYYPPQPLSQPQPQPQQVLPTLLYGGVWVPNPHAPPLAFGVPKVQGYDPSRDAEVIRKATKGFGSDDELLIKTLTKIPVLQMDALADYYVTKFGKRLVDLLDSETSGYFGMGVHALATGPLAWDIELLNKALSGAGTNEDLLTELILGRTEEDVFRLTMGFRYKYGVDLAVKIKDDLSGKTERLFMIALNANRPPDSSPVDPNAVAHDIETLFAAGQGQKGKDEMVFFDIILRRSTLHLAAVIGGYGNKYRSLTKVIKSEFTGHMRDSLLYVVQGAKPKRDGRGIWRDAKLIDKAMVGFGTRDSELVWRIVRAHWDPARMNAIKEAYQRRTRKTLAERVAKETSGSYKKLMMALIEGQLK